MGPAIANERVLLKVGGIQTTHPEVGQEISDTPPPAPDKIRALLPKLADLPKEAEEKIQTETQLRARIRALEVELRAKPKAIAAPAPAPAPKPKAVEIPIIHEGRLRRIEAVVEKMHKVAGMMVSGVAELKPALLGAVDESRAGAKRVQTATRPALKICPAIPTNQMTLRNLGVVAKALQDLGHVRQSIERESQERDATVSGPQLKILRALAMFEALGISDVPRTWVAPLADTTHSSSGFEKNVSTLTTGGYIERGSPGNIRIRAEGRGEVGDMPAPTEAEILSKVKAAISRPQAQILDVLVDHYPADQSREEIAAQAGTSITSSGFEKNMGTLRTAGMIEYSGKGRARAAAWLFTEHARTT
jgi:hypothetical protein